MIDSSKMSFLLQNHTIYIHKKGKKSSLHHPIFFSRLCVFWARGLTGAVLIVHFQKLMPMHLFCVILCNFTRASVTVQRGQNTCKFVFKNFNHTLKYGCLGQAVFLPLGMGGCIRGSYLEWQKLTLMYLFCVILCNFNLASVTMERGQNHSEFVL